MVDSDRMLLEGVIESYCKAIVLSHLLLRVTSNIPGIEGTTNVDHLPFENKIISSVVPLFVICEDETDTFGCRHKLP